MSRERCNAVKNLMKQAIGIMNKGECGDGRGLSIAITYAEDAFMRLDYHMRQNGWLGDQMAAPAVVPQQPPRRSTLVPAAPVPQLNTGLMQNSPVTRPAEPRIPEPQRDPRDVLDDISLLD